MCWMQVDLKGNLAKWAGTEEWTREHRQGMFTPAGEAGWGDGLYAAPSARAGKQ